ncbi:hypothetical protein K9N08_03505 [Candidatus Gracilibacteria bacterium]|nr:hypothetical protein [Candidatus Gracilibacteria bacterium]MCF7856591.1 hypothetical protein [Candidatus Gracilibacteria bacterium]MCF7896906.1 hypothetical protein [Candidatus Gracilibacteria bacterium]
MPFSNPHATATLEQQDAANATIELKNTVDRFITASKWTTGIIIVLTIVNVLVAIFGLNEKNGVYRFHVLV